MTQPPPLDEALDDRRIELDLQWTDVATAAGISLSTLGRVRKGVGSKKVRRAVERALRLEAGSIERGIVTPLPGIEPTSADRAWDALRQKYEAWRVEYGPDPAWAMLRREIPEMTKLLDQQSLRHLERQQDHRMGDVG